MSKPQPTATFLACPWCEKPEDRHAKDCQRSRPAPGDTCTWCGDDLYDGSHACCTAPVFLVPAA